MAQRVVPFVDFNNYFRSFENDNFRQLEFQPIKEYKAGDDLVAYIDTRGNLRVYDGKERKDISNMNVQYQVSDHLMAYNIGPTLNMWDEGKLQTLTYFSRNYLVKDSIIVYEDTRFNTVNVYWNKQTYILSTTTGDLFMPEGTGDNIVAFKDNGNFYKVFWRGEIYDLGVWNNKFIRKVRRSSCPISVQPSGMLRMILLFGEKTPLPMPIRTIPRSRPPTLRQKITW